MLHRLRISSRTTSTILSALWPITWAAWLTQTWEPSTTEHNARCVKMSHLTCSPCHIGLRASSVSFHLIPSMHVHVGVWPFSSSCPFTSCPSPSSTSSWFLPWCLTSIPWNIPCATPASGAWSGWTMSHPTHATSLLSRGQLRSVCRRGNDHNCFSHNYFSSDFAEQSQKCVKNMNVAPIERGNPLWEDSQVPHSWQAWSRPTCLWIVMIMFTNIFHYKKMENELKSYHNKKKLSKFCMDVGFLNAVEIE